MQMNLNSHALYTDHYEFTMLDALVQSGQVDKVCFEVFVRTSSGKTIWCLRWY